MHACPRIHANPRLKAAPNSCRSGRPRRWGLGGALGHGPSDVELFLILLLMGLGGCILLFLRHMRHHSVLPLTL